MTGKEIILMLTLILVVSAILHCASYLVIRWNDFDFPLLFTPMDIYYYKRMNIVGSIITWILLLPFCSMFELLGILKYLFTLGRK